MTTATPALGVPRTLPFLARTAGPYQPLTADGGWIPVRTGGQLVGFHAIGAIAVLCEV